MVLANGQLFGFECKADAKKKPTDLQIKTMNQMEEHGAVCLVVCDNDTIDHAISLVEEALNDTAR